ncbi:MAG: peptidylprolyl isomerase [Pseudanabaenaceae cyanobacterium]
MTLAIYIGDYTLTGEQVIHKLIAYNWMQDLVKEVIIDQAIADVPYTPEEVEAAQKRIVQQYGLATPDQLAQWLASLNYDPQTFRLDVTRGVRLQKFKQEHWGAEVPNLFLQRKQELDRAVYSILRLKDISVAQELYFRLQGGEQTFQEIATKYSLGAEASTGGLVGPVELGKLHPTLKQMLSNGKTGQLFPPQIIDQWIVIVRLEQYFPAQLDEPTKERLIHDAFSGWLQEKIKQTTLGFTQQS